MHKTKHHLQLKTKQSLGQAGFGLNPEPTNNRPILSPKSTYWPLVEEPKQTKPIQSMHRPSLLSLAEIFLLFICYKKKSKTKQLQLKMGGKHPHTQVELIYYNFNSSID
jgi:redox-sensitive bicupin YhaK (pirin superfamily)